MLSFMKIIPLLIILHLGEKIFIVLLLLNILLSSFFINLFRRFKLLLFFSSILNTMYFLILFTYSSLNTSIIFLGTYFLILLLVFNLFRYESYDFVFGGLKIKNRFLIKIYLYSIVGIPFRIGFTIKSFLVRSLYYRGLSIFCFLAIVLSSILFSYYYIKILVYMFISAPLYDKNLAFLTDKGNNKIEIMRIVLYPFVSLAVTINIQYFIFYLE